VGLVGPGEWCSHFTGGSLRVCAVRIVGFGLTKCPKFDMIKRFAQKRLVCALDE